MSSIDEVSKMFDTESKKLETLMDSTNLDSNFSIHDIVETYYQIMNVSSIISMLKQQLESGENKELSDKISQTEQAISQKFNSSIHPKIMEKLNKSIAEITTSLQSNNSSQKSKEEIETESKFYEELRQMLSTKEFVQQYDKGLHD